MFFPFKSFINVINVMWLQVGIQVWEGAVIWFISSRGRVYNV